MKRREFVWKSAGLAGVLLPDFGLAGVRPCLPGTAGVKGGASVDTSCDMDAESDWLSRRTAPGVVWAHDFRHSDEVEAFVQSPVSGVYVRKPIRTADGPTGHCMEFINSPGDPAKNVTLRAWKRIFSPVRAVQNGLPYDDAAAGGSIALRDWHRFNIDDHRNWGAGWYGHPDYQKLYPNFVSPGGVSFSNAWDGHELYVQFRVKISGAKWDQRNDHQTKMFFFNAGGDSIWHQLVGQLTWPNESATYFHDTEPPRVFTAFGNYGALSFLNDPQGTTNPASIQPGSNFASTCLYSRADLTDRPNACWEWPRDAWTTVLIRLKLGHHNQPAGSPDAAFVKGAPYPDTELEMWVAPEGETQYTKVYRKTNIVMVMGQRNNTSSFGTFKSVLPGHNMFEPTSFVNVEYGQAAPKVEYSLKFTQIILSRDSIPCPQV